MTPGEVNVFAVAVPAAWADDQPEQYGAVEALLSPAERAAAGRLRKPADRARAIAARGALRHLLGRHLRLDPRALELEPGEFGKPRLADRQARRLRLNVAHSAGQVLVAIGNDREVGVDVEQVRPDAAIDEIAAEYFSPREQAAIHRLPPADRDRAGFACWTLKEAYLKARGGGLDRPLDDFDVLDAQTGTGSGYGVSSVAAVDGWSLRLLQLGDEYAGAVAAAGTGPPLPATPRRLSLADLTTG